MALDLTFFGPFAAAALGGWAMRKGARRWLGDQPRPPGWACIRPSAMHWTGLVGAAAIVCLMAYVGLFIGSARADAAFQMRMLWLLVAAFSASAGVCLWQMRQIVQTDARWRGSQVSWQPAGGGPRLVRSLTDVAAMHRPWFGRVRIVFADGAELQIDPYGETVPDLWNRIVGVNEH
jgi:hypothetical protein